MPEPVGSFLNGNEGCAVKWAGLARIAWGTRRACEK